MTSKANPSWKLTAISLALFAGLVAWAVFGFLLRPESAQAYVSPDDPPSPSLLDAPLTGDPNREDHLREAVLEALLRDSKTSASADGSSPPSEEVVSWPEAKAVLRAMCTDFGESDYRDFVNDALYWPGDLREPNAERFPDFSHAILNPDGKDLGPVHVEELEGIVTGYNELLKGMAMDSGDLAKAALLDFFDKEQFEKYTVAQEPPSAPIAKKGHYTLSSTITIGGWTVRTRFSSMEYPQLESLLSDIETLKSERIRMVKEYIAAIQ